MTNESEYSIYLYEITKVTKTENDFKPILYVTHGVDDATKTLRVQQLAVRVEETLDLLPLTERTDHTEELVPVCNLLYGDARSLCYDFLNKCVVDMEKIKNGTYWIVEKCLFGTFGDTDPIHISYTMWNFLHVKLFVKKSTQKLCTYTLYGCENDLDSNSSLNIDGFCLEHENGMYSFIKSPIKKCPIQTVLDSRS